MPSRKEINLEIMTQEVVSKMIAKSIQSSFGRLKEFHKWSLQIWSEEINGIQDECRLLNEYLLGYNPTVLQCILTPILYRTLALIRNFSHTSHLYILDGAKYFDIRETCRCILGSIFFPCIQELDITLCEDFSLGLVIENLGPICNLKKLNIANNVAPLTLILGEKISILTKLRALHCNSCTNHILSRVAAFCQELDSLKVRYSNEVDDSSVRNIIRLQSLQSLDISETSISDSGYLEILQNLPKLKNVCWVRPIEELVRNLPIELTSNYVRAEVRMVEPATFCTNFLNISELHITSQGNDIDLSVLSQLIKLTKLTIKDFDFVTSEMDRLLQESRRIFRVLALDRVCNVDGGSIINNCKHLKSLNLAACGFRMSSSVNMEQASSHFKNLQLLNLSQNTGVEQFYEFIQFYQNLQVFHVVDTIEIDDNFVRNLVDKNVFIDLVIFFAVNCPLKYETAIVLINNCENLKKMGDLNFWKIDKNRIKDLSARVRSENLDLQLIDLLQFRH